MIETNRLRQQILDSLADLRIHFRDLTNDDIAADIINVVCKHIITSKNLNYKTSSQPMDFFNTIGLIAVLLC